MYTANTAVACPIKNSQPVFRRFLFFFNCFSSVVHTKVSYYYFCERDINAYKTSANTSARIVIERTGAAAIETHTQNLRTKMKNRRRTTLCNYMVKLS